MSDKDLCLSNRVDAAASQVASDIEVSGPSVITTNNLWSAYLKSKKRNDREALWLGLDWLAYEGLDHLASKAKMETLLFLLLGSEMVDTGCFFKVEVGSSLAISDKNLICWITVDRINSFAEKDPREPHLLPDPDSWDFCARICYLRDILDDQRTSSDKLNRILVKYFARTSNDPDRSEWDLLT